MDKNVVTTAGKPTSSAISLDGFGNPKGLQFDLGGSLDLTHGKRILLYSAFDPQTEQFTWKDAADAVAERGCKMDIWLRHDNGPIDEVDLSEYDQLWFVSEQHVTISRELTEQIDRFLTAGKGLLIWTDNEPYFADGTFLAHRYTGSSFYGCFHGDQVLTPSSNLTAGHFIDHPLTSGLNNLYEGITISAIVPGANVTVLAHGTEGHPCMAAFDNGEYRVVLDTGFTKLLDGKFAQTAGTARYFRNIAFWLLPESRNHAVNAETGAGSTALSTSVVWPDATT